MPFKKSNPNNPGSSKSSWHARREKLKKIGRKALAYGVSGGILLGGALGGQAVGEALSKRDAPLGPAFTEYATKRLLRHSPAWDMPLETAEALVEELNKRNEAAAPHEVWFYDKESQSFLKIDLRIGNAERLGVIKNLFHSGGGDLYLGMGRFREYIERLIRKKISAVDEKALKDPALLERIISRVGELNYRKYLFSLPLSELEKEFTKEEKKQIIYTLKNLPNARLAAVQKHLSGIERETKGVSSTLGIFIALSLLASGHIVRKRRKKRRKGLTKEQSALELKALRKKTLVSLASGALFLGGITAGYKIGETGIYGESPFARFNTAGVGSEIHHYPHAKGLSGGLNKSIKAEVQRRNAQAPSYEIHYYNSLKRNFYKINLQVGQADIFSNVYHLLGPAAREDISYFLKNKIKRVEWEMIENPYLCKQIENRVGERDYGCYLASLPIEEFLKTIAPEEKEEVLRIIRNIPTRKLTVLKQELDQYANVHREVGAGIGGLMGALLAGALYSLVMKRGKSGKKRKSKKRRG